MQPKKHKLEVQLFLAGIAHRKTPAMNCFC